MSDYLRMVPKLHGKKFWAINEYQIFKYLRTGSQEHDKPSM